MQSVSKYGVWELAVKGPEEGNPFKDQSISLHVEGKNEKADAEGFYDGDGIYRVRFMPSFEGEYTYTVKMSFADSITGSFTVTPAEEGNHGPVRTVNTSVLAYDDGSPYISIGTTCYVWELQSDEMVMKTLETLKNSAFNKIRFCIFPKHYVYNFRDPRSFPYEGTPMDCSVLTKENFGQYSGRAEGNEWDFERFNPAHFRHIEYCVRELGKLGIEADIILFHPYDRWGFSLMTKEQDLFYMHYMVARFAAYHNVWWSLANEYDLMKKSQQDWLDIAGVLCGYDPYNHMRSIHNCFNIYDFRQPWCTHCSIQRNNLYLTSENTDKWIQTYNKPVVLDEIAYEGDIQYGWGNLTGEEMLRRFWEAAVRGGYPGHGETMTGHDDILWWSHGGELHGESHKRFGFLKEIMAKCPGNGLRYAPDCRSDEVKAVPAEMGYRGQFYLHYYSFMRPYFRDFNMPEGMKYEAFVIDTWEMTCVSQGVFSGKFIIKLPSKPYMAIMLVAVK